MQKMVIAVLLVVLVCGMATVANAQTKEPRFQPLTREQMTDAQKRVYDSISSGPRGAVRGPSGPDGAAVIQAGVDGSGPETRRVSAV